MIQTFRISFCFLEGKGSIGELWCDRNRTWLYNSYYARTCSSFTSCFQIWFKQNFLIWSYWSMFIQLYKKAMRSCNNIDWIPSSRNAYTAAHYNQALLFHSEVITELQSNLSTALLRAAAYKKLNKRTLVTQWYCSSSKSAKWWSFSWSASYCSNFSLYSRRLSGACTENNRDTMIVPQLPSGRDRLHKNDSSTCMPSQWK